VRAMKLFLLSAVCLSSLLVTGGTVRAQADPLADLVSGVQVGRPVTTGPLRVYPLLLPAEFSSDLGVVALPVAFREGTFEVSEMPGARDQFLLAGYNGGDNPVFGQGGGYYQGGGQNRGGGGGFMMAPLAQGSLPVLCFEEGREEGPTSYFDPSAFTLAPPVLRSLVIRADQTLVWRELARQLDGPMALSDDTNWHGPARGVAPWLDRVPQDIGLEARFPRGVHGVLVACGDRIVGMDLYGDPQLYADSRTMLTESAGAAAGEMDPRLRCTVDPPDVARFLRDLAVADKRARQPIGIEDAMTLEFGTHLGEVIAYDGRLVHLGVYDSVRPGE